MKTTKQLLKELENESVFWLAWAIVWRIWVVGFAIGFIGGLLSM